MTPRWAPEGDDLYRYMVALHGFDPLAERDVVREAEALLDGGAK